MFSIKRTPKTSAEQKLEQVIEILFPPLRLEQEGETKYHIDFSADTNLDAVLIDLEEGHNDEVAQKTIRGVANRLVRVRKLLEAYAEIDKDAKYIIVDDFGRRDEYHDL